MLHQLRNLTDPTVVCPVCDGLGLVRATRSTPAPCDFPDYKSEVLECAACHGVGHLRRSRALAVSARTDCMPVPARLVTVA